MSSEESAVRFVCMGETKSFHWRSEYRLFVASTALYLASHSTVRTGRLTAAQVQQSVFTPTVTGPTTENFSFLFLNTDRP